MSGIKSLLVVVVLFGTALAAPTKDQDSYSDSSGSGNSNGGYSYDSANSDSGSYDSNSYDLGNDSSWSSSANQWAASSTWSSPPYTTTSVQWTSTAAAYGSAETSSAWKYTSTSVSIPHLIHCPLGSLLTLPVHCVELLHSFLWLRQHGMERPQLVHAGVPIAVRRHVEQRLQLQRVSSSLHFDSLKSWH
jgi:hypothetical protein